MNHWTPDDEDTVDELPAPPRKTIPAADRELLEMAARALGAVFEEVEGEGYGNLHFEGGAVVKAWNPLQFSGDAFEMAAGLGLLVDFSSRSAMDINRTGESPSDWHGGTDDEPAAATRRAVTRAAAEIGRTK